MLAKKFNTLSIEIIQGDISEIKADALVNAANNHLYMGAGVAGALKRKGGVEIEKEAVKKGPIEIGGAIETGAYKLQAKYVIHAAVMGMDFETDERYIREATMNTLILANKLKVKTIAFPALGTGVGRFSLKRCAEIMFDEILKFDREKNSFIEKVFLVLFTKKAFDEFEEIFRKL